MFDKLSRYKILNFESKPCDIQRLILSFSSRLSKGGCGEYSYDLTKTVDWVSQNNGCCSDYSQTFLAVAKINGLFAREVHHNSHTFNEYYDETLHKWIWVDANFKLMALGRDSIYLSLLEIRELFEQGKQPKWYFFGNDEQRFFKNSPAEHKYFDANEFQNLRYTNGNNVFQQSYWLEIFKFFPKELRQFMFLSLDILPSQTFYANSEYVTYFKNLKYVTYSIFCTLFIVNLFIFRRPLLSFFMR
jgi:hypothetical protein